MSWVLSIKTNRAEHNGFSCFMFAHNNKAAAEKPSMSDLLLVACKVTHGVFAPTQACIHYPLSPPFLLVNSWPDHWCWCVLQSCYIDAAQTPAPLWSVVVMGKTRIFTGVALWWMHCCHGNTMVKLPAVPPTLTAHLGIFKRQLSLCSLWNWVMKWGVEKNGAITWKWHCTEGQFKRRSTERMFLLGNKHISES